MAFMILSVRPGVESELDINKKSIHKFILEIAGFLGQVRNMGNVKTECELLFLFGGTRV
jgi:hypothetical protein